MKPRAHVGPAQAGIALVTAFVISLTVLGTTLVPGPRHAIALSEEGDREAVTANACGIERWHVKTGIDPDARRVNIHAVTNTSISHLRSLPPPSELPSNSRISPVETTVYRVSAILLRSKIEADSDVHLVISDTGGRTMIAEIPSPSCVGSSSPFLPQIRYTRQTFDSRFHPNDVWHRTHLSVQVVGVGFFDFKHGQSGVAPNAIELHPVLGIHYGGTPSAPPPPPAKPAKPTGSFSLKVWVSPNPVSYGDDATLYAQTKPGASCTASVLYSTGRAPRSFDGSAQTVGSRGKVSWSWHMESKGTSGTGTVTCTWQGKTKTATAGFTIS